MRACYNRVGLCHTRAHTHKKMRGGGRWGGCHRSHTSLNMCERQKNIYYIYIYYIYRKMGTLSFIRDNQRVAGPPPSLPLFLEFFFLFLFCKGTEITDKGVWIINRKRNEKKNQGRARASYYCNYNRFRITRLYPNSCPCDIPSSFSFNISS